MRGDILIVKIHDLEHNTIYKSKANILDRKAISMILFDLYKKFNIDIVELLNLALDEMGWQP